MRNHGRFLLLSAPALGLVMFASGCGLPGTFGVSSEPTGSPTRNGTPNRLTGPAASANTVGTVSSPGPTPILPLNLAGPESPQDVISLQSQKLAAADDDRKLLAARLLQLQTALNEKEDGLAAASKDITKTEVEIDRARVDIRRVKQENAALREKLDKTEKELIEVQKQNIKMREKEQDAEAVPPEIPMPKGP